MANIRTLLAVGIAALGLIGAVSFARTSECNNEQDTQLVTIKGKVLILNHPELGRTEGRNIPLVFQREDCKKCLVATVTDENGNYEIYVGRGRYAVSYRDARGGGAPAYEMLAKDQPRYVDANSLLQPNQFDVKVLIPPK